MEGRPRIRHLCGGHRVRSCRILVHAGVASRKRRSSCAIAAACRGALLVFAYFRKLHLNQSADRTKRQVPGYADALFLLSYDSYGQHVLVRQQPVHSA